MGIVLRSSFELQDDDEVLIHMGAGAAGHVIRAALNNYRDYAAIRPPGAFTVSVYAAIGGVSEQMIVAAMPQRQYGVATYGELRRLFELWPTTDEDADLDDAVKEVHFDIVLPDGGYQLPPDADLSDEQVAGVHDLLRPAVDRLLELFLPRRPK